MGTTIEFILQKIVELLIWGIILNAILSWLVAFDVINLRHPMVRQFARFLDAVTRPVLAPFRRFIPPLGGIDITPIIAIIVLNAIELFLIPWLFGMITPYIG